MCIFIYRYRIYSGFPGGTSGKELACQFRRHKKPGFDPWVRKIPWRKAWQPTPVPLPGGVHGQRSLAGFIQSIVWHRVGHDRAPSAARDICGLPWCSVVKKPPAKQETSVQSLGQEDPLEKEMATRSGILA